MRIRQRILVSAAAIGALVGALALGGPAAADQYPSWDDVQKARSDVSATDTEINRITGLLEGLRTDSLDKQNAAMLAADEAQTAQYLASESADRLDELNANLAEAQTSADESTKRVGALVAQLSRSGRGDIGTEIFIDSANAEDALYRLSTMSKVTEKQADVLAEAERSANLVASLTEQAKVESDALASLQAEAEAALQAASAAAQAASIAVAEQENNEQRLIEQLAVLKNTSADVESGYQEGVAERARIEAERQRQLAEERRRAAEAAAAAAANRPGNSGGGSSSGGGGGGTPPVTGGGGGGGGATGTYWQPSAQGWYRPAPGPITSWYGPRKVICGGTGCSVPFHAGIDFGDACGTPLKAIANGTIVRAYNAGGFGNRIVINHGGVTSTYGHLSGFAVSAGQQVSAGQVVGYVGRTGVATGCHLDLKINNGDVDPAPFLRGKGVRL